MMLILTLIAIFVLLVASEIWWKRTKRHGEVSRKFIHISVGSFAAFWPFYLSWTEILILCAGFIIVVALSKYFDIFSAIHAVERPTYGEVSFALAVGALVFITQEPWIYTAALLHMSLADGLAAIIGVKYGKNTRYKVLGHDKSIVGSLTFFVVSVGILLSYAVVAEPISLAVILGLAAVSAGIENLAVAGLDNLFVPLLVGVVLTTIA